MDANNDVTKEIVIVSDGTGKTARRLMDAVLIQYSEKNIQFSIIQTFQQIRTENDVDDALGQINDDSLVLFSIVSEHLADYLTMKLTERKIIYLSVLQPMLDVISKFLGVHPDYMPGKLQIINDNYYRKIDAIGYAVRHDDGNGQYLGRADAVLVGISRTCKTPVSMYLACNYGLNVANIPVVIDDNWTEMILGRLESVASGRIIGLVMQPDTLASIRENRSHSMVGDYKSGDQMLDYYEIRRVVQEYRYSVEMFETHGWPVIDVTKRAIEEISSEIYRHVGRLGTSPS